MSRESEQKIRRLCQKVVAIEPESDAFESSIEELRGTIHEHIDDLRDNIAGLAFLAAREKGAKAA
jgi:hypothetical protein